MALGYFKGQFETSPQTEVATASLSTKTIFIPLLSVNPKLGPSGMERDDELRGVDEPLPVIPEAYDPEHELETRAYPDSVGFLLKAALGNPVTTAGNGVITDHQGVVVPTGAFRHVWTAPFYTGITPQTIEGIFAYKDSNVFFRQRGMSLDSFSLEAPEKGGARFKAQGKALHMARIADPALTPAYESLAIRPFTQGGMSVTGAGLTGTPAQLEEVTINASTPTDASHTLGVASKFPTLMERGAEVITFSGTAKTRNITAADFDAMQNLTGASALVSYQSDSFVTGAYPYKLGFAFSNVQLVSGEMDDLTNAGRRFGASWNWKATYNGTASTVITLVNLTTSYA